MRLGHKLVVLLILIIIVVSVSFGFLFYYRFTVLFLKPLEIEGPSVAAVGEKVTLTVTSNQRPVKGVLVAVDNQTKTTNENGSVTFTFHKAGRRVITASKEGYEPANFTIDISAIPIRGLFIGSSDHEFFWI